MRLVVLLLVLAVSTQAGLLDLGKVKDFFKGGNFGEKIKTATFSKFKKLFEKTGILSLGNKLAEMRSKVMKKLELSKAKKAEIDRKLKEIAAKVDNTVEKVKSTIFEINAVKNVGKSLFQSDILLTKRQVEEFMEGLEGGRAKRQAFKNQNYPQTTWQQGVFYRFDNSTDYLTRKMFEMGAKEWEEATCVDFKEDKDGKAENSLILIKEDGCWSFVGRLGGEQPLSLGKGCEELGIATHEIGHALGLYHTMSRYDRDDFITIVFENVKDEFVDQFVKFAPDTTTNYGFTYDYGSIMHYEGRSASKNKEPTMIANDTRYQETMGSQILSFIDKSMINDHYNCKAKCPKATSAKCQNGGFPHPRKCSECICPSGYGGALCDQRPTGCGSTLKAKESKQFIIDKLGFPSGAREQFMFCNYWIEAPEGKKIEVKINSISHGYGVDGCIFGGVEIKSSEDQTRTGYRFCSPNDRNTVLVSASNRVPIITFNRAGQHQIILEYKIVS